MSLSSKKSKDLKKKLSQPLQTVPRSNAGGNRGGDRQAFLDALDKASSTFAAPAKPSVAAPARPAAPALPPIRQYGSYIVYNLNEKYLPPVPKPVPQPASAEAISSVESSKPSDFLASFAPKPNATTISRQSTAAPKPQKVLSSSSSSIVPLLEEKPYWLLQFRARILSKDSLPQLSEYELNRIRYWSQKPPLSIKQEDIVDDEDSLLYYEKVLAAISKKDLNYDRRLLYNTSLNTTQKKSIYYIYGYDQENLGGIEPPKED